MDLSVVSNCAPNTGALEPITIRPASKMVRNIGLVTTKIH